VNDINYWPIV